MSYPLSRHCCVAVTLAALITGCDSSGGGASTSPIALSGPASAALAEADQLPRSTDGSVGIIAMLSGFPAAALTDFSTRFPGSVAEEQFRTVTYNAGVVVGDVFGLEGENDTDTAEVTALYSADGTFLSSVSYTDITAVPASVTNTINSLYPAATLEEVEQLQDENGVMSYSVELEQTQSELELLLNAAGALIETNKEIATAQVPAVIAAAVQQELTGGEEIEYEQVTFAQTGAIVYEAELEQDEESVELEYDETGQILSMTFEQEI